MASRREARERILELLYEADIKGTDADALLAGLDVHADPFTEQVVRGVLGEQPAIEAELAAFLRDDWSVERLSVIDRVILRASIWELRHLPTPKSVVLAEAVELAQRYGGDTSGRFVNGVLAAIAAAIPEG